MHDHSPDGSSSEIEFAEHLKPFDQLLRFAGQTPAPECPDGLCHRTLERCLARVAETAAPVRGAHAPTAL